ncbi:MAG: glycosyl hydrolase family 65 protein [Solirubrobacterales bacterium]
MTELAAMQIDAWALRETELRIGALAQTESLFALSNGHIGMRGNLDEGEPTGQIGTFLNGVYEIRPLPHAETAYGYPEAGETVVSVPNGKLIRLLVDDELMDARYGTVLRHERVLDFRDGILRRTMHWRSPTGQEVLVESKRLVSLHQRGSAAILYEVTPINAEMQLVVQSELVANGEEIADHHDPSDPRMAAVLERPLQSEEHFLHDEMAMLIHRTKNSGIRVASAMDHQITGPEDMYIESETGDDIGRVTVTARVPAGQKLSVLKHLAYGWSGRRSRSSVRAQVRGSLSEARHTGWDGLVAKQKEFLAEFWDNADVLVEGDDEMQQAVRFALFHLLQASARGERRAIPAKGLTGSGYDGHAFWDTETFVLPVMTYTWPQAARDALHWRHNTLDMARERAKQLSLDGATFPWRTIAGRECSGYWPASTAAFHVSADVSDAVLRYVRATGDEDFHEEVGVPILVETARMWLKLGAYDNRGEFRIAGVTGPDEYSAIVDNNVYTNLMAARNLRGAAAAAVRFPEAAATLDLGPEEPEAWLAAADAIHIPYDEVRKVHPQADNFTHHEVWPFDEMTPSDYPLMLNYPYFDLYRKQVIKQADLVLALFTNGDYFTPEQKRRNFEYYEAVTVRDSSLSACGQAVVAAETGHLELAYKYLQETALVDLHNLAHNTSDGLHLAASAGTWLGLVCGFGGFRDYYELPTFAPRLPENLSRLAFNLRLGESTLRVDVTPTEATYSVVRGPAVSITHCGEQLVVAVDAPVSRKIEEIPPPSPVKQPKGRAPDEIKTTGTQLDETGALLEVEGDYPHQAGHAV